MDKVTIIDADKFEVSKAITYSVSELKEKIASENKSIAELTERKANDMAKFDEKIAELTAKRDEYQAELDKAANAGMVVAEIAEEVIVE